MTGNLVAGQCSATVQYLIIFSIYAYTYYDALLFDLSVLLDVEGCLNRRRCTIKTLSTRYYCYVAIWRRAYAKGRRQEATRRTCSPHMAL